jgi:hypothetical protein
MERFILLSIAILLFASITKAQITRGSTFIGGSLNFSSDKNEPSLTTDVETTNASWAIKPQIGKAIRENKVAGIFLNFGGAINKQERFPSDLAQTKNEFYGGGVFFRNYFLIASRFYLFGDASLGVISIKNQTLFDNGATRFISYNSKSIQSSLFLTPGVSFAASKKVQLEAALNNLFYLSFTSGKSEEYSTPGVLFRETKSNNLSASANANGFNNVYVGIRFIIP